MSYATIMVHVDVNGELNGRVQVAGELAGRFGSRLMRISAWMPRPPFALEGVVIDPALTEEDLASRTAWLKKRGDAFRTAVGLEARRVDWRCSQEFPGEYIAREARAADLVVIGGSGRRLILTCFRNPAHFCCGSGGRFSPYRRASGP